MSTAPSARRILTASLVGTAVEFYDFYVYATAAALVLGPLFFPSTSASAQLLLSWATFGLAFVARPVGGVLFGHFGDRVGRKSTLVASLLLMGASTALIGCLPTYASAGWVAPAILCVLRFGQGLGLGGEWGGASLLAVENAPAHRRNTWGMFPPLGAPVGFIAANGFFLLLGLALDDAAFRDWGWRVPFLASALLVGLGLWVRLRLVETPAFAAVAARSEALPRVPIATLLREHARATLAGTFGVIACFALFYLATAYALNYGVERLGRTRETMLLLELGAILFLAAGIVTASVAADRSRPERLLAIGFVGCVVAGLAMPMLGASSLLVIWLWLAGALFAMGFCYGPLGGWLPSLFPVEVRYTGVSVTFNAGGIIGGALAPIAAEALWREGGLALVGAYLVAAGVLSLGGLALVRRG